MKVVKPPHSNLAYFMRNDILHSATMSEGIVDIQSIRVFDFFDDESDWEEGLIAIELLTKETDEHD